MNWPIVGVYIPTFNRASIVARTVELLRTNLIYSGRIEILVGCDGTDDTADRIQPIANDCLVLTNPSGSLGANVNRMVSSYRRRGVSYMIGMDDDHHLVAPLNIDRHVRKLHDDVTAARIHLLMEAKNDEHFDSYRFTGTLDKDHYWRIDWECDERFIMSFRPHIVHERWWEVMGLLPEGKATGLTEWEYSGATKMMGPRSGIAVFVPLQAPGAETWHHVGDSWNRKGL